MTKKDASKIFTQAAAAQEKRYKDVSVIQTQGEENVQIVLRVPAEMRRQMKIAAAKQDKTMNDWLRSLIAQEI